MLSEWLKPAPLDAFLEAHRGRAPHAATGGAETAVPLLDWHTLDRVLAADGPHDVLTVARGALVPVPPPASAAEVKRLMRLGVSTVIRQSERHDPALAALAAAFAREVPGEVHVQLYATPAGTHSFGWHYDFEDVFIAQTRGKKDYYFCDNTVARDTRLGDRLDFSLFRVESAPLLSARLHAGDWLYLPSRWWHLVKCVEHSLSLSIGVMPHEELRRAHRLPDGWGVEAPR